MKAITWKETRYRIKSDHSRLLLVLQQLKSRSPQSAYLHPSFICILLYRFANHFCRSQHNWIARFFWHLNLLLTGADISEYANIDKGLVVLNPPGISIMGTAGRNLTVMACAGLGAELGRLQDIGAGPGFCLLGNDVIMEPLSGVLGPVRVGDRVRIGAGVLITKDVPDDTLVEVPQARFIHQRTSK